MSWSRIGAFAATLPLACGPTPSATSDGTGVASSSSIGPSDTPPTTGTTATATTTGMTTTGTTTTTVTGTTISDSGTHTSVGAANTSNSSGETTTSASATSAAETTTGGLPGEPADCPVGDWSSDCRPNACISNIPCGSLFSEFDADGLFRSPCEGDACACGPDRECFVPYVWGGCAPSVKSCGASSDDCGGAYCVPKDLGPPFACGGTDEAGCAAAGCTFVAAPWVDGHAGACECGPALPLCLWFPEAGASAVQTTAYYHAMRQEVRLFPTLWTPPPFGWKPCANDPEALTACECAEQCAP